MVELRKTALLLSDHSIDVLELGRPQYALKPLVGAARLAIPPCLDRTLDPFAVKLLDARHGLHTVNIIDQGRKRT